ncbi:MAG: hypothetical protein ABI650_01995, partial [Dokdonella sp.]
MGEDFRRIHPPALLAAPFSALQPPVQCPKPPRNRVSPVVPARISCRNLRSTTIHTRILSSRRRDDTRRQAAFSWRARLGIIAAMALVTPHAVAQPAAAVARDAESATHAPWDTDAVLAIGDYVQSPSFNNRRFYVDHFAGPSNADAVGALAAQLSNGDIVVAGLVPNFQASGTCNNGAAMCNVGLVRYTSSGVRIRWPDPNGFGFFNNNYLIYPNNAASGYQYIRDVKVQNGTIYVLLDVPNASQAGLGRQNTSILTFSENGRPRGSISVFGLSSTGSDAEDFYGAQMAFTGTGRLIVTATDYDGTSS